MGVLRVEGVEYRYPNSSFSLYIEDFHSESKSICGILGPNGAGKSTLLKIIAGILKPRRGRVLLDGLDILRVDMKTRARMISYIGQNEAGVSTPFTALQIVLMGRTPWINPWIGPTSRDVEISMEALKRLGAVDLAHRPFSSLSGGERQRVLLARAIVSNPKIMLLDEPLSNLDPRYRLEAIRLLREVVREIDAVCLVTLHDMVTASMMCDYILLVKSGRIVAYGSAEDVLCEENVLKTYDVRAVKVRVSSQQLIIPFDLAE